jgi:hypothetical protein
MDGWCDLTRTLASPQISQPTGSVAETSVQFLVMPDSGAAAYGSRYLDIRLLSHVGDHQGIPAPFDHLGDGRG